VTRFDGDVPACTACGTCCFSTLPHYIRVFGVDWERMGDRARTFAEFDENRCYMRIEDGHCAALVIDPVRRSFMCSIYEERPDCCRWLEPGSGVCLGELDTKRERPLIAVEALLRRASKASGDPSSQSG
jgi:uncharacterized protein